MVLNEYEKASNLKSPSSDFCLNIAEYTYYVVAVWAAFTMIYHHVQ